MRVIRDNLRRDRAPTARPTARRGGYVLVYTTLAMAVIGGIAALTFDLGRCRSAKGELQAAADAAALNAACGLVDGSYVAKGQAAALENKCDGTAISLASSDVVAGNWSGTTFAAGGTPRNAVRVTVRRTTASGAPIKTTLGNLIGKSAFDVQATTTVALVNRSGYEWAALNSVSLSNPNAGTFVTAYDATNSAASATQTNLKSDGSIALAGNGTANANLSYGTTSTNTGVTVTGSLAKSSSASTYPPGSAVANINGATWAASGSMTFSSSSTVPGGTYVLQDFVASNCNVTFTGPTTIVVQGNLSISNSKVTTASNLPKNLKIIATKPGTTISITNPLAPFVADFYAPGSDFTLNSGSGYYGLKGRGVFKSLTASGAGASLMYDRSMDATTESREPVIVD